MRFLRLSLAQSVPDANSVWNFREPLTRAKIDGKLAIEVLFKHFDAALTKAGFLAMAGQIIYATIVAAPKQRNTEAEKEDIKEGRIPEDWKRKPAKLRQKDRDARWTVKYSKAKPTEDGAKRVDLAIPAIGYKNHVGIDRAHGLIRTWAATDASRHDGTQLPNSSTRTTPPAASGRTRPIDPRRTKSTWPTMAFAAKSTARSLNGNRCPKRGAGQRQEVEGSRLRRTRLRPTKDHDGSGHSNNRPRRGHCEDGACQSDLQHEARHLAVSPNRRGLSKPNARDGADRLRSRDVTASRPSGPIVPMESTVLGSVQLLQPFVYIEASNCARRTIESYLAPKQTQFRLNVCRFVPTRLFRIVITRQIWVVSR
jgi:hypothetical protein